VGQSCIQSRIDDSDTDRCGQQHCFDGEKLKAAVKATKESGAPVELLINREIFTVP
jgi:hypothetical protein